MGEEYTVPIYAAAEVLRGSGSELASELLRMISEDEGRHAKLLSLIRKSVGRGGGDA